MNELLQFDHLEYFLYQKKQVFQYRLVKLYATILKNKAHCFLLDEPLANIYPELQSDVLSLLNEIAQNNLVIIISHDLGIEEKTKNIRIR